MPPRKTTSRRTNDDAKTPPAADRASPPPAPPPLPAAERRDRPIPQSSEPWKNAWSRAAAGATSVLAACEEAGVSLLEFLRARQEDSEFDESCRVHDGIVDERIKDALRTRAAGGDARAQALYYARVRDLILSDARRPHDRVVVPSSAEAAAILRYAMDQLDARRDPGAPPRLVPPSSYSSARAWNQ